MPTPVITHNLPGPAVLSGIVDNTLPTANFLTSLIFGGREETLFTESVEWTILEGGRKLAPFVSVNSEAVTVQRRSITRANVSTPNIRMKMPMDAFSHTVRRGAGMPSHVTSSGQIQAEYEAAIAADAKEMRDRIDNRVEWMVASMITDPTDGFMRLSFTDDKLANWTVSVPRHVDADAVVPSGQDWDACTFAQFNAHILDVKAFFSARSLGGIRMCIVDDNTARAMLGNTNLHAALDRNNLRIGVLDTTSQYNDQGAYYVGSLCGVEFWAYNRTFELDDGTVRNFMNPSNTANKNVAVFIATGDADSKIYYGPIPDHEAIQSGLHIAKTYAKAWLESDPSLYMQLVHTRPLPMIRRPNCFYVLDTKFA